MTTPPVIELTPAELATWLADESREPPLLVDVREEAELQIVQLPQTKHLPMPLLPLRMSELPDNQPLVLICHHGVRSHQSALYLLNAGFEEVHSLKGGIDAWAEQIDSTLPRY